MDMYMKQGIEYLYSNLCLNSDYIESASQNLSEPQIKKAGLIVVVGNNPHTCFEAMRTFDTIKDHHQIEPHVLFLQEDRNVSTSARGNGDLFFEFFQRKFKLAKEDASFAALAEFPQFLTWKNQHELLSSGIIFVTPGPFSLILEDMSKKAGLSNFWFDIVSCGFDGECRLGDDEVPGRRHMMYHLLAYVFNRYYWQHRDEMPVNKKAAMEHAGMYLEQKYRYFIQGRQLGIIFSRLWWQTKYMQYMAEKYHHRVRLRLDGLY